jgi:hypothetical protein
MYVLNLHDQVRLQDLKMCLDLKNKEEEIVKERRKEERYRKEYEDYNPGRVRTQQEAISMKLSELGTKVSGTSQVSNP